MTFNLFKLLRLWPPFGVSETPITTDPIRIVYAVPQTASVAYRVPTTVSITYDSETQE